MTTKKLKSPELEKIIGGRSLVGKGWYYTSYGWASGIAAKKRFPGAFLNNAFFITNK